MRLRWHHMWLAALAALLFPGCAVVSVKDDVKRHVMADVAAGGSGRESLSIDTRAMLSAIGRRPEQCRAMPDACAAAFGQAAGLGGDQIQASLAELYLAHALDIRCASSDAACQDRRATTMVESARHAYLYLFFGDRPPELRAFERRQVEVLAFYNRAVEEFVALLYSRYRNGVEPASLVGLDSGMSFDVQLSEGMASAPPQELVPAARLAFGGVRNVYRRDGFGAEFVAVQAQEAATGSAFRQLNYQPVTMLLTFDGDSAVEVARARSVTLKLFDAHRSRQTRLGGRDVPLAANFSAAYGLWLARTNLVKVGMSGLFGRAEIDQESPRVIMLEPYDPGRRVLILVHGLASSQEAWINLANEVTGDPVLRDRLQIWLVVYPTRMPLLASRAHIEKALRATFAHFDPSGTAVASHDAVLVGHSMGGVIARLLVTPSDPELLDRLLPQDLLLDPGRRAKLAGDPVLAELLHWSPLPQIGRAVFVAAPHRGAPLAERRIGRMLGRIVRLPLDALRAFETTLTSTGIDKAQRKRLGLLRPQNGIDDLAQNSRLMLAIRDMPIESGLPFHSIIARKDAAIPLERSSDGLVPYTSAHLPGAASEKVIIAGHSVQETPEAILELRRILHEHIDE